jgi:hypothetical protein
LSWHTNWVRQGVILDLNVTVSGTTNKRVTSRHFSKNVAKALPMSVKWGINLP